MSWKLFEEKDVVDDMLNPLHTISDNTIDSQSDNESQASDGTCLTAESAFKSIGEAVSKRALSFLQDICCLSLDLANTALD